MASECQSLPIVYVRGNHYEVGHTIGTTFRDKIQKYLTESDLVQRRLFPFYDCRKGREICEEYFHACETAYPQYVSEIKGTASGAGIAFEKLFLLNISKEVYNVHSLDLESEMVKESGGCSTVYVNKPDLKIIGHNEDCDAAIRPYGYMVNAHVINDTMSEEIVKCKEERFMLYLYPGFLPGNNFAFNKNGFVLCMNGLYARHAVQGAPTRFFVNRSLLSMSSIEDAVRLAKNTGSGCAYGFCANIASTDQPDMYAMEVGPCRPESKIYLHKVEEVKDTSRPCHYFHINLYKHLNVEQVAERLTSTRMRTKRAEEMPPPTTENAVKGILGDTTNTKYPIFRRKSETDKNSTAVTAMFNMIEKKVDVYMDNPKYYDYLFSLPLW